MAVKVYTKEACGPCTATKRKLKKNGVEFEEISIENTPGAREYIQSLGYAQAPVVVTDDASWSGFEPDKLEALVVASAS